VKLGAETYDQDVRVSGNKAVFMGIWVLPNANALDVMKRVRAEVKDLQREIPSGLAGSIVFDATQYIDDAVREVKETLGETLLIVIFVIFLFLGSLRTVLVPLVAIPVSLIGAVFLMQAFGFTVNLLTLLSIVLSVGLVVDDAIVVVENIQRHLSLGRSRMDAALIGARELVGPIIAMTVTLAAVYAPIGLQGGITGALFREFALTLSGAVFISGVVALTLSPMMCSRLLVQAQQPPLLARLGERGFEKLKHAYERALDATLKVRPAIYAMWLGLSLLIVPMYMLSPTELAPTEDQGVVFGAIDVPPNATLEQLLPYTAEMNRIYHETPECDHTFQLTFPTLGFAGMLVKPWGERKRTIFQIQGEVAEKFSNITGVRAPAFVPPPLPSAGTFPIEFVITASADHDEILRFADRLSEEAMKSGLFAFPPFMDVRIDQAKSEIVIDRDKVASMGLSMQEVGADLSAMLSGNFVNRFSIDGRSYKVIAQIERGARLTPDQLTNVHIGGPGGQVMPLGAVATLKSGVEPRTLNRFQQLNAVKLSGLAPRSLDGGLKMLEAAAARILPAGYHVDYTGESRQLRQEGGKFLPAMGLSILLIFLVLAAQFNSFRDPFVILAGSVPLAMFGALIFTFLKFDAPPGVSFPLTEGFTTTLNIYSQVGLVTLVGLVAKNGILIVEFANEQQKRGLSKLDAVRLAAGTRLRPIMMTTVATVVGHFPLTLVTGAGAVARNSIGVVLVGGMTIGTLFTLFVVPSLYVLIAKEHHESDDAPMTA
jgi:multidrug efflux pump